MRLENKTALITGAASGFGREMARRFVREGARVAVVDLNGDGAKAVAAELGDAAIAVTCDVANGKQVADAVAATIKAFGRVDIAINNAGWSHKNQPVLDVDEATFKKVYAINVDSIFHMTHAIVPHWREIGGGVMINVGSTAGIRPRPVWRASANVRFSSWADCMLATREIAQSGLLAIGRGGKSITERVLRG